MAQIVRVFDDAPTTFDAALEVFLAVCRARNLSPNTVAYYQYRLQAFHAHCGLDPAQVKPAHIRDFLAHERETNSATTAHHALIAVRRFFAVLVSDGILAENPALAVEKPKRRKTVIPTFSSEQVDALLATCNRDFYGIRDRAMILTLLDTGLRVQELVSLTLEDVSLEQQQIKAWQGRQGARGSLRRECSLRALELPCATRGRRDQAGLREPVWRAHHEARSRLYAPRKGQSRGDHGSEALSAHAPPHFRQDVAAERRRRDEPAEDARSFVAGDGQELREPRGVGRVRHTPQRVPCGPDCRQREARQEEDQVGRL